MKPRTACCCLLGVLCCWTQGYPETIYRHTDKNGVRCFTNSLIGENFHYRGLSDNPNPLRLNCNGPANKPRSSTGGRWKPRPALCGIPLIPKFTGEEDLLYRGKTLVGQRLCPGKNLAVGKGKKWTVRSLMIERLVLNRPDRKRLDTGKQNSKPGRIPLNRNRRERKEVSPGRRT